MTRTIERTESHPLSVKTKRRNDQEFVRSFSRLPFEIDDSCNFHKLSELNLEVLDTRMPFVNLVYR